MHAIFFLQKSIFILIMVNQHGSTEALFDFVIFLTEKN